MFNDIFSSFEKSLTYAEFWLNPRRNWSLSLSFSLYNSLTKTEGAFHFVSVNYKRIAVRLWLDRACARYEWASLWTMWSYKRKITCQWKLLGLIIDLPLLTWSKERWFQLKSCSVLWLQSAWRYSNGGERWRCSKSLFYQPRERGCLSPKSKLGAEGSASRCTVKL